jgi:hypothetical protein
MTYDDSFLNIRIVNFVIIINLVNNNLPRTALQINAVKNQITIVVQITHIFHDISYYLSQ